MAEDQHTMPLLLWNVMVKSKRQRYSFRLLTAYIAIHSDSIYRFYSPLHAFNLSMPKRRREGEVILCYMTSDTLCNTTP